MALIETKLGTIDDRYLDLRVTPVDDAEVYGQRIEVWPKPVEQLLAMQWEIGDPGHPNCHRGAAISMAFRNDTVDPVTREMGPGTMVVHREEFHPPNCVVTKLIRSQRVEPIAVYGRIAWEKVNPFEETPDEVEVDLGDGKISVVATSTLTKEVTHFEDEREFTYVATYRDASGRVVKREPNVKLKTGVAATGAAANF